MAKDSTAAEVTKGCTDYHPGLYLAGTVVDRVKKNVQISDKAIEVVTYTIDVDRRRYFVDDFDPSPESYLKIGAFVSLPVYVKPYKKKNGDVSYLLKIQKDITASPYGEHF